MGNRPGGNGCQTRYTFEHEFTNVIAIGYFIGTLR